VHAANIQGALGDYLVSTRAHEWAGSNGGGDDSATRDAIGRLERIVRVEAAQPAIGTPASSALLSALNAVTGGRRSRLAIASRQLPVLYVVTLVAAGVALVLDAAALSVGAPGRTAVLIGALAVSVALSLALLFAISAPFRGPLIAGGQPIDAVIHDLRIGFFSAG